MAERRGVIPVVVLPSGMSIQPALVWGGVQADEIRTRLPASSQKAIVAAADRVVGGTFDLLGLSQVSYGVPVRWQFDPLSGREAALDHWSRVPYLDFERVGDHKITWELNRHQWLITLGQAWVLTGEARYVAVATRLVREWLEANPPKRGINWCSALEMAFRVQSWIQALRLFGGAPDFPLMLKRDMVASAALQIDHITRNLSTWFSPNTHLTGEAAAVLAAGCAWPELPGAARWRSLGWKVLCDECTRQIRADGVYFEQSAWYQSYTVDIYVLGVSLARRAGLTIPSGMLERVRLAANALQAVTRPDGTIARLGDDDGGRLLPFTKAEFGDMTDSLWRAAYLFDDAALIPPVDSGREALLWLEGTAAFDAMARRQPSPDGRRSVALRSGGWIAMSEAGAARTLDHWLVFDVGPHGALSHAHSHADALAIDLTVRGVPMLVDPGTMSYVGQHRRRYRSTAVHNTVTVDGTDSSEQGASFNWRSATDSQLEGFGVMPGATFAAASHDGYRRRADPVRHHRTILRLDRRYWIMLDRLDAAATHQMALTFQAAPNVRVAKVVEGQFTLSSQNVTTYLAHDAQLTGAIERRVVSPAYALEQHADAIVVAATTSGPTVVCTAISADDEAGPIAVQHDAGRNTWTLTHRGGRDLIAAPAGTPVTLGPVRFDGTVLALIDAEQPHTIVAAGSGTVHLAGQAVTLRANDVFVAHCAPDGTWTTES